VLVNGAEGAGDRGRMAWCPQEGHLFDSTIRGNLLLARARDDRPADAELTRALELVGLGEFELDLRVGPGGSHLSGGERQRLAVARTLLTRADVVLLDEPTAHLDEASAERLMANLREALSDRIVVLVTHHPSERRVGDARLLLGRLPQAAQDEADGRPRHHGGVTTGLDLPGGGVDDSLDELDTNLGIAQPELVDGLADRA
jgi:ATP-binding cassette subfamily C protein CydCD